MKKIILFLILLMTAPCGVIYGSPPTRTYSYVTGTTISSSAVTSNEDSLFNYLSLGVDTYADNSILGDDINTSAAIPYSKLSLSNSIVNADINSSAAIAYSKLTLTGAVLNADLAGSIADTKLSQITTASKVHGTSITGLASLPAGAGVIPVANLGSGSPSSANFLRGDGAWTAIVSGKQIFTWSFTSTSGATEYIGPGDLIINATATNHDVPVPVAGTAKNMYIRATDGNGSAGTIDVTLQVNGSDSALTAQIPSGAQSGNYTDLVNTVAIAAGDRINLKIVSARDSNKMRVSFEYDF